LKLYEYETKSNRTSFYESQVLFEYVLDIYHYIFCTLSFFILQIILILKKPYRKKEWNIKLEDITNIEKERLFITRGKNI